MLSHLFLVAGLQLATKTGSPVEKVVELIKELKTKIETDGANEQKIYDKFACWCETTSQRKADAIDDEKKLIGTTTTRILTLKGAIAVLTSEVADREGKIARNEDSMKTETGIRTKENGAFQESKAYMETTLSSLHTAIEVLSGAGTGGDKATKYPAKDGLFLMKVASQVRSAILSAPEIEALPESKSKVLKRFLEEPVAFLQATPEEDYYDQKAQAKASYSPASATIMGILKDMYDTFAADLEKSNTDESALQKAFEDHIAAKEKANADLKREILGKEEQSAQKSSELSEAEATLAATTEQKSSDETIFESTRSSCKDKSDEWDERGRLRTEQLVGINQALEILTDDANRDIFIKSTGTTVRDTYGSEGVRDLSFVQVDEQKNPRQQAFLLLKQMVAGTNNLRLARIAAMVRRGGTRNGHFDDVIANIDKMIDELDKEMMDDVTQKAWCISEQHHNEDLKSEKEYTISQIEAKIERAQQAIKKMEKKQDNTREQIADLKEMWEDAEADRVAESEASAAAKSDDEKAVELLGDAIAALSQFEENNAFLQVSAKKNKKSKQPVFELDEDSAEQQAPEFSGADNHGGAQHSIIDMMKNIKEELENEIALSDKAEEKAIADHAALKEETDKQLDQYNKFIIELDGMIASQNKDIEDLTGDKTKTEEELRSVEDYLLKIKPNCEWIKGAIDLRAAQREKEKKGLREAKAMLAGAHDFVQTTGNIGFLRRVQ
jgi:hypothetical protein